MRLTNLSHALDHVCAPLPQQRVGVLARAHDLDERVQALVDRRRLEARREAADDPLTVAARYRRMVFTRRDARDARVDVGFEVHARDVIGLRRVHQPVDPLAPLRGRDVAPVEHKPPPAGRSPDELHAGAAAEVVLARDGPTARRPVAAVARERGRKRRLSGAGQPDENNGTWRAFSRARAYLELLAPLLRRSLGRLGRRWWRRGGDVVEAAVEER